MHSVVVFDCIPDRKIALTENVNPESLVLPQLRYLATHMEPKLLLKLAPPLLIKQFAASILTHVCLSFRSGISCLVPNIQISIHIIGQFVKQ
jgi:hypothetical protein